ncbi:MAG: AmmeMemoRadiSam system radical SAM enzyme [Nanoarchaeota archaeon]|nr:AmmeMemoRadiSam system radical SAM enzyme [Nanoarchaeota archaeon]
MKEAKFYEQLEQKKIRCLLCPKKCVIKTDKTGFCRVRKNKDGKLYTLVYNKPATITIDPIEKKPLFHFFPQSKTMSIGTIGCNLYCKHCQNWQLSQGDIPKNIREITPEEIIKLTKENNCQIIAYTYNEPTIFYEYMIEIAKLAKKEGIKNIIVTNGYINEKPLKELCKYIDAANVDLKGFSEEFYKKQTTASLKPVLNTLTILKQQKVWTEITNLIIPTLNDKTEVIKAMCEWIRKNLGNETPLHFTAFHPDFKTANLLPTTPETLIKAMNIAKEEELKYVYIGNVYSEKHENTYCPNCEAVIIKRRGFLVLENNMFKNKCEFCSYKIQGVF